MFVRRTQTRRAEDGQSYFSHRLVHSERVGSTVRQRTLLNLGRHFDIPQAQWPLLCTRIEDVLSGQAPLVADGPPAVEREAQRIAAQLVARGAPGDRTVAGPTDVQRVDVDSLRLVRPRSVGVEQVGLWALEQLGLPALLADLGVNLYDLTNTYFEGEASEQPQAQRGHSKEKRSDCPLLTLGLMLDASGFVRRSQLFAGNVREHRTLAGMLEALRAPAGALVVMDRGVATDDCVSWLREHDYRYLVVSRERHRQFDAEAAVSVRTQSKQTVHLHRVVSTDPDEVRLYARPPKPNPNSGPSTTRSASTRSPAASAEASASIQCLLGAIRRPTLRCLLSSAPSAP